MDDWHVDSTPTRAGRLATLLLVAAGLVGFVGMRILLPGST